MQDIYEDIRPYTDAEVAEALPKLAKGKLIAAAARYLYPDKEPDYLPNLIASCKTTDELQEKVVAEVLYRNLKGTNSSLTHSGLENFTKSDGSIGAYVLLSTHRDIVLDPAFVEYVLFTNGLPGTEISAGDNLLEMPEVEVTMRANRMIKVVRSDNPRVLYTASRHLSAYIRDKVTSGERSLWISHRGGRTKDGNDRTETGLLKMLDMSGQGSFLENFSQLPIMPVTVSYEYETCGALKTLELYRKAQQGFYKKQPGEDVNSMLQGFLQEKGRIQVSFCKPLSQDDLLRADEGLHYNDKIRILADILDEKLLASFKLWPTNYAAADMVKGTKEYLERGLYTLEDKEKLTARLHKECEGMPEEIYPGLLKLYAAHLIESR